MIWAIFLKLSKSLEMAIAGYFMSPRVPGHTPT